jgi:SNF2 family DNA or RNA helicase
LIIFRILKKLGLIDELFVLAKRRIIWEVWPEEIKKWRQTRKMKYVICHGKDKEEKLLEPADIRLMNYEGLLMFAERRNRRWQLTDLGVEFFRNRGKRVMLAVDESSKLRHTDTLRFKCLKQCLKFFKRRYILTGSPAPNSLMNLFGQIYTLDLGESLGTFITQYRNKYFMPTGYMGKDWKLQKGGEKRIFGKLSPLIIRYGNDQLSLPPLTFIDKYVDLPPKAAKLYYEMEKEFIIKLKNDEIVAANAAVATGKCRQIANGGCYYNKNGDFITDPKKARGVQEMHTEKCEVLVDLLEELEGEPALVTFEFTHDMTRLRKYLKTHAPQFADAPFVGGKMKDKEFAKYKKKWDRGELPVMFGNPESIAHGLNLQGKGGIVIFFALTYNLENYEQFIQRVWRQGQKRRVIVYRLIARNTVDVDMIRALKSKDKTQQALLRAMEKRHGLDQQAA